MAVELFQGKIPIIRRDLNEGFLRGAGDPSYGCLPRDYDKDPVLMGDSPNGLKLYDDSEWDAVYDACMAQELLLYHQFLRGDKPAFVNLDQNGDGYCWAYSTGGAMMLDRLKQNLPPIRLNPHATAAIIKRGRDEGGVCGESLKWAREFGYAVEGTGPGQWPLHSRNLKYDTPELRAQMALHKASEDWYDLGKSIYDQVLTKRQIITLGLSAAPMALDYNRFSHSMCGVCVVRIEPGYWGPMVLQSWKGWGYHGLGILADMWPDNAVAIRSTTPSMG